MLRATCTRPLDKVKKNINIILYYKTLYHSVDNEEIRDSDR